MCEMREMCLYSYVRVSVCVFALPMFLVVEATSMK